jgi:2,4-dienoyl-CoA reductase-like NADH-dependent reductase (Old Yellow Enzyme family)
MIKHPKRHSYIKHKIKFDVASNPEFLREGQADFVSIGRGLIADPGWPIKAATGQEEEMTESNGSCHDKEYHRCGHHGIKGCRLQHLQLNRP